MHRFFVNPGQIDNINSIISILGSDVKHIRKVLRLKEGQELEICDGEGMEYRVLIDTIHDDKIDTIIEEVYPSKRESNIRITLYQGLPKSMKMDIIIQKCTELGIHSIIPISTNRTIVKIENSKAENKKIERWQRIAYEAAKQSKRGRIPQIGKVKYLQNIWEDLCDNELNIIAYENESTKGLKQILYNHTTNIKKIGIIIGPEGGFEEQEIEDAKANGVLSFTLGPRILRTETAGFTALTIVMYALGDIGGI
jgi:16S rRNA (uracil1498-N3)-methyltransferase